VLDQINKITRPPAAKAQSGDEPDDNELERASQVLQYKPMPGPPVRSERPHGEQAVVGGVDVGAGAGGEGGAGGQGLPVAGSRRGKKDKKPRAKRRCRQCMDFGGEGVDATRCRGAAGTGSCETFEMCGARKPVPQSEAAD
jgi:hypothetical protein